MNPSREADRGRLSRAVKASFRNIEPFRNLVHNLVRSYTGPGYGWGEDGQLTNPINLMNQVVDAYTMSLAANRPRVLISTQKPELAGFAKHYQVAMNNLVREIGLELTLRQAVLDAFFCVGIVKVHLADSAPVQLESDLWMDPGQPFASNVSIDNWVHDMSAKRYSQVQFAGDMYRIPREDLESDVYDQKVVKRLRDDGLLRATTKYQDSEDQSRLERISQGSEVDQDEFLPMIDLLDLWVPREKKVFTFLVDAKDFSFRYEPVAAMDWDGPEHGPYRLLGFGDVPENVMPNSPALHLEEMNRLANNLLRKQSLRAESQKEVFLNTPAGKDSATNVQRAGDNDFVTVADTSDVTSLKIGGIDANTQAFEEGVIAMFDRMAGNLSAMLGLGPQADTAKQEQLIHGAVSKKEAQLQYRTLEFADGVISDLGHMLWKDEAKVIPGTVELDGVEGYDIDSTWYPGDREGRLIDYDLTVDIHSMPYQSPGQRVQAINNLLMSIYVPLAPVMAQQGYGINVGELREIHADLLNEPRFRNVIYRIAPQQMETGGEVPSPPNDRVYQHQRVPTQGSVAGQQQARQMAWIGNANQGVGGNTVGG